MGQRVRLDELDMRIVREMLLGDQSYFRADRVTVDEVARKLDVHRNTVAERLRKMRAAGFFLPLSVDFEPSLGGLVGGKAFLDVPAERRTPDVLEQLFLIEGVHFVITYLEGWDLILYAEDGASLDARLALAKALTGARTVSWDMHTAMFPAPPPLKLKPRDLDLLGPLLEDGRASARSIAHRLGLAPKTVERRIEAMRKAEALTMLPGGGGFEVEGMVMAYVTAELAEGAGRARALQELLALFPNYLLRIVPPSGPVSVHLYARSLATLQEQVDRARRLPAVHRIGMRVMLTHHVNPAYAPWLMRVLRRRVG
jgi:DNA-binding Lrp family transcriptional regulator